MNIVIVGDGKVGYALTEQLSREGHDITVIDNDRETLNESMEALDIIGIKGNGATRSIQEEAGVPDADLLIAATSGDELNMICCLMAKHLGCHNTIARIRNPEYMQQIDMFKEEFGLSMVINPEHEAAREISRIIKFPPATKVDVFSKGQAELVEFKINADSPLVDKRIMDLLHRKNMKILICAVERSGRAYIPNGAFILRRGDSIYLAGDSNDLVRFINSVSPVTYKIRSVMIVGGGRVCYYLTQMLDNRRYEIKIIEKDHRRCEELCEWLPGVTVIHGDGSDQELLKSEGMTEADAFIALTGMDEENLIMSMLAKKSGVPKVVTKVNRFNYLDFVDELGIDSVISPKMGTAVQITQYVRAMQNSFGSKVDTLHKLVDGKAEALEFTVGKNTRHLGKKLQEIPFRKNLLLGVIVRNRRVIIPGGQDVILQGDNVVVITNEGNYSDLNDIFQN